MKTFKKYKGDERLKVHELRNIKVGSKIKISEHILFDEVGKVIDNFGLFLRIEYKSKIYERKIDSYFSYRDEILKQYN